MARFVNNFNYKDGISYFQHAQYNAYFNSQTNQLVRAGRKDAQKIAKANLAGSALVSQSVFNNTQALQQIEKQNARMHSAILGNTEVMQKSMLALDTTLGNGFYNISDGLANVNESLIVGFNELSFGVSKVNESLVLGFDELKNGMKELGAQFNMGFTSIVEQFELQRKESKKNQEKIIEILQNRKKTNAYERFKDGKSEFESYLKFPEEVNLLEDSLNYLLESANIYNGNPYAHLYLGHIYQKPSFLYDLENAKEHYRLCASHSKKNDLRQLAAQGFFMAGWASFANHKLGEAIELTEEAWKYDKENIPEISYNLAKFHAVKKSPDKSLYYLDIAVNKFDYKYSIKASLDRDFENISLELGKYFEKIRNDEAGNFLKEVMGFINLEYNG